MVLYCRYISSWTMSAEVLFPYELAIPASVNYLFSFGIGLSSEYLKHYIVVYIIFAIAIASMVLVLR